MPKHYKAILDIVKADQLSLFDKEKNDKIIAKEKNDKIIAGEVPLDANAKYNDIKRAVWENKLTDEDYVNILLGKFKNFNINDALVSRWADPNNPSATIKDLMQGYKHFLNLKNNKPEVNEELLRQVSQKINRGESGGSTSSERSHAIALKYSLEYLTNHSNLNEKSIKSFIDGAYYPKSRLDQRAKIFNNPNFSKKMLYYAIEKNNDYFTKAMQANVLDKQDINHFMSNPNFIEKQTSGFFRAYIRKALLNTTDDEGNVQQAEGVPPNIARLILDSKHGENLANNHLDHLLGKLNDNERKSWIDKALGIEGGTGLDARIEGWSDEEFDESNWDNWINGEGYNPNLQKYLAGSKWLTDDQAEHIKRHGDFDHKYKLYHNTNIDPRHGIEMFRKWHDDDEHHNYDARDLIDHHKTWVDDIYTKDDLDPDLLDEIREEIEQDDNGSLRESVESEYSFSEWVDENREKIAKEISGEVSSDEIEQRLYDDHTWEGDNPNFNEYMDGLIENIAEAAENDDVEDEEGNFVDHSDGMVRKKHWMQFLPEMEQNVPKNLVNDFKEFVANNLNDDDDEIDADDFRNYFQEEYGINPRTIDFSSHDDFGISEHPEYDQRYEKTKNEFIEDKLRDDPWEIWGDYYADYWESDSYRERYQEEVDERFEYALGEHFQELYEDSHQDHRFIPEHLRQHLPEYEELKAKGKSRKSDGGHGKFLDNRIKDREYEHAYGDDQHLHEMIKDYSDANGGSIDMGKMIKIFPNLKDGIKKVFSGKGKLSSEQIQEKIDSIPKTKYDISYGQWASGKMQNLNGQNQTLIRLDHSDESLKPIIEDSDLYNTFKKVQNVSKQSGHPTKNNTIAWARVDMSDPEHWMIDELQSDFGKTVIRYLKDKGHDDKAAHIEKIFDLHKNWRETMINHIIKEAKKHGVKKVSTHSPESKNSQTGGGEKIHTVYKDSYKKVPRKMGFQPVHHDELPINDKAKKHFEKLDPYVQDKIDSHTAAYTHHLEMAGAHGELKHISDKHSVNEKRHLDTAAQHLERIKQYNPRFNEEDDKPLAISEWNRKKAHEMAENNDFASHDYDSLLKEPSLKSGQKNFEGHTYEIQPQILKKHLEIVEYFESLEKGELKQAAKGLALSVALMNAAHYIGESNSVSNTKQTYENARILSNKNNKDIYSNVYDEAKKDANNIIKESQKNWFLNNKATTMSPIVYKQTIKNNPELNEKYRHTLKYNNRTFRDVIEKNPHLRNDIHGAHFDKLHEEFEGNLDKIQHAWENGIKATHKKFSNNKPVNHTDKRINSKYTDFSIEKNESFVFSEKDFNIIENITVNYFDEKDFNNLEKTADEDQLLNFSEEEKNNILEWSRKHIKNLPMRVWYLNHINKKPELHEQQQKNMEHHGAMHKINSYLKNIKFNKKLSFEEGLSQLENADKKWQKETLKKKNLINPESYENLQEILPLNEGWSWFNLGKSSCEMEGQAMGHCGGGKEGNTLFSLRKKIKKGNKVYHEPHLTFEINPDGIIVQAKGKGNTKPEKKYHAAILPLLLSKYTSGVIPSEYKPDLDFQFSDLSPEMKEQVNSIKPNFDFFNSPYDSSHPAAKIDSFMVDSHKKLWENFGGNLKNFSNDEDASVRELAAEHPNHTPETLMSFANDEDAYVREAAARNSNHTPESLMSFANDKNAYVRRAAARHSNHTPESLKNFSNDEDASVREAAARHSNHTLESIMSFANDKNRKIRRVAAQNPNHTPESLMSFANDEDADVREAAARHSNHTLESIMSFANDEEGFVKVAAAENPNHTLETIMSFANDEYPYVREAAARYPNHTPESLMSFANDKNSKVRRAAAENPNHTLETIMSFANDKYASVREAAARYPNHTPESLMSFANDEEAYVRKAAAKNPNHTSETLMSFANDKEVDVRRAAAKHSNHTLESIMSFANDKNAYVRRAAAQNPNHTLESIMSFANDEEAYVREIAAENPNHTPESLMSFANDEDANVRRAAAQNPNHTLESIMSFANDEDVYVRRAAAENPNHTPESLMSFANDEDADVREAAALNPNHTLESIMSFANDKEVYVRRAAALNPNHTPESLMSFANDKNAYVRQAATKHPNYNPNLLNNKPQTHNDFIRSVADSYAQSKGLTLNHNLPKAKVNPEHAAKIADTFSNLKHDPSHPEVQNSYNALIQETKDQFNHIVNNTGLKISKITPDMKNPYKNSKELFKDIHENNHLWFYPTEIGFGSGDGDQGIQHPMLQNTDIHHEGQPLLANDLFRIVHDYFGHAKEGNGFSANGEENAWMHHKQMYSPLAAKALTAETKMQNSWVNFGPHGEHNRKNPAQTIYADQKATIAPDWVVNHSHPETMEKSEALMKGDVIDFNQFKRNRQIKTLEEAKPTVDHTEKLHPRYKNEIFQSLHERFSGEREQRFKERMEKLHRKVHEEPYHYGDSHDIQWGDYKDQYVAHGLWNTPFAIPAHTSPEKVNGVLGKNVHAGGPDPIPFMDMKFKVGLNTLEQHRDLPLEINTRSDLIANDKYMKNLNPELHTINIHVYGDNDNFNKNIEPGTPSYRRRLKAAEKLHRNGFKVNLVHNKLTGYKNEGENHHKAIHNHLNNVIKNIMDGQKYLHLESGAIIPVKTLEHKLSRPARVRFYKNTGIKLYDDKDIEKSEALMKGSLQRRNRFNPNVDISEGDRTDVESWIGGYGDHNRNRIKPLPKFAKLRALNKLHKMTDVKRHPKTGERMFLMHRGMDKEEYLKHYDTISPFPTDLSSWTPKYTQAQSFAYDYSLGHKDGPRKSIVVSAWIPESQIHHVPNAIGSKSRDVDDIGWHPFDNPQKSHRYEEHEVIVKPHKMQKYYTDATKEGDKKGVKKLMHQKITEKMDKTEDLAKGSLQRRNPFNPMSTSAQLTRDLQREWTQSEYESAKKAIKPMSKFAKLRAMNKLSGNTKVARDPETGERMFLMHRGASDEEFNEFSDAVTLQYPKGHRNSWTHDINIANDFGEDTVSAWIPESKLIHSVNQFNIPTKEYIDKVRRKKQDGSIKHYNPDFQSRTEKEEQEWIVEHDGNHIYHANPEAIAFNTVNDKINRRGINKNEDDKNKGLKNIIHEQKMWSESGRPMPFDDVDDSHDPIRGKKEDQKVKETMEQLKTDTPNPSKMFQRVYSVPSEEKMKRSKKAAKSGQVPSSINVYGAHFPVVKLINDNTLLLHTSDYGKRGKTRDIVDKIRKELPEHFPDFKIIEIHHPDYRHSSKVMRLRNKNGLKNFLKDASINHPDEKYRNHALDALEHIESVKKGEYTKPIHAKRTESEGWDYDKNLKIRLDRINSYLQSVGLTPDTSAGKKRDLGAFSPTSVNINTEGDPEDQQMLHEGAHAMQTPEGVSLEDYQHGIGEPGFKGKLHQSKHRKELKEAHSGGMPEQVAQQMEGMIARRSGVEPFRSPQRGAGAKNEVERSRQHAKNQMKMFDEGIYRFDPFTGENELQGNINAYINAKKMGNKDLAERIRQKLHEHIKNKKQLKAQGFTEDDLF